MILYRNCGGIGPRLERMDHMGIGRMCSLGALSNRLVRSEYPPSPTSTTVEFQSSLLVRRHHSSFCSPPLCRPHCQVHAASPLPSYPYWRTPAGGSGLAVATHTAQSPFPIPPRSESEGRGRSAGWLARRIFGECPVS
jgi:hypothetical protein